MFGIIKNRGGVINVRWYLYIIIIQGPRMRPIFIQPTDPILRSRGDEGDGDPTFLKQFHSIDFYVGRAIWAGSLKQGYHSLAPENALDKPFGNVCLEYVYLRPRGWTRK